MKITVKTFASASFAYYVKSSFLLAIFFAIVTGVLFAALISGDSLKMSLAKKVEDRLGKIAAYAYSSSGLFDEKIFAANAVKLLKIDCAGVNFSKTLKLSLNGVDENFWNLADQRLSPNLKNGNVAINERIANALGLSIGDEFVVSFVLPNLLNKEHLFSDSQDNIRSVSLKVSAILSAENFSDFGFEDSQIPSANVFCSLDFLQEICGVEGKINYILSDKTSDISKIYNKFSYKDFSLEIEGDVVKCRSWFLPKLLQSDRFKDFGKFSLAWFIDEFKVNSKTSPYGFALGMTGIAPSKAQINAELAKDLSAKVGDKIVIEYFYSDNFGVLKKGSFSFEIEKIFDMKIAESMRGILPHFEGLTNADECSQWKSKVPIDFEKVRKEDEYYWKHYSYAPKILISYEDAKTLWASSYGSASALKIDVSKLSYFKKSFENLTLAEAGFNVINPWESSIKAAKSGTDFDSLFLGLSFFVILAALILQQLFISLILHLRRNDISQFVYFGFSKKLIYKIFFYEFFMAMLCGLFLGILLGILLGKMLIFALGNVWSGVSMGANIEFYLSMKTLIFTVFTSFIIFVLNLKYALFKAFQRPKQKDVRHNKKSIAYPILVLLLILALLILGLGVEVLWIKATASLLILLTSIFLLNFIFSNALFLNSLRMNRLSTLSYLRNKRIMLPLTSVIMLAMFLIFIVGLNNFASENLDKPSSASGGFTYYLESILPITLPLKADKNVLPIKVMDASKADCLNLTSPTTPQVMGLDWRFLESKGSFSFAGKWANAKESAWALLSETLPNNEVPALVDSGSLMWILKKKLGDVIEYSADGKIWKLKIVGALEPSILQGSLIISDENFMKIWKNIGSTKIILADKTDSINSEKLLLEYKKFYPIIETSTARMEKFNALQNAYLRIFLQLGIIAILLAATGMVIMARASIIDSEASYVFLKSAGWNIEMLGKLASGEFSRAVEIASVLALLAALPTLPLKNVFYAVPIILIFIILVRLWISKLVAKVLRKSYIREEV